MTKLVFRDLSFLEKENKVIVSFLDIFYFELDKSSLEKIGPYIISKHSIEFNASRERAEHKFNFFINQGILYHLKNKVTGRKTIYIHRNSGIPLIGTNYFGIIDRGTSLIEIKPITGCNLNCCYCSIDEGRFSKTRVIDFIVEKDYLVEETKKVVDFKGIRGIEIHIGPQGEPLLYRDLAALIKELSALKQVSIISMDTNGVLLNKKKVDILVKNGLNRFNLSINAINHEIAKKMADTAYDVKKVLKIASYIVKKTDLIITPVWVPGINDQEIPKIVEFSLKIGAGKNCPPIGVQNFLCYKFGRKPVKEKKLDIFYQELRKLEHQYNIQLITSSGDYGIKKAKSLPKPFKKGDLINATIVCEGRLKNEMLAVSKNRVISVPHCREKIGKSIKLRIVRSKHNIFTGLLY